MWYLFLFMLNWLINALKLTNLAHFCCWGLYIVSLSLCVFVCQCSLSSWQKDRNQKGRRLCVRDVVNKTKDRKKRVIYIFYLEMSEKNKSEEVTALGEEQKETTGGNGSDSDVHPDDGALALNDYKETCIFCRIAVGKEGDKDQGSDWHSRPSMQFDIFYSRQWAPLEHGKVRWICRPPSCRRSPLPDSDKEAHSLSDRVDRGGHPND